jgi:NADH-quinone oxidoreductase subunit N
LFENALENGYLFLVIIAVICSIISVGYYFKIILAMFGKESNEASRKVPVLIYMVAAISMVLNIIVGVFSNLLLELKL